VVVKVLDFGIAKSAHPDIEHGLASTTSSVMVGSPPYMAPEQLNPGSVIDARTDLWAAGVVLYQLLSGHLPFEGENLVGLMFAIQNRTHRPLSEVAPGLPAGLYRLVNHCLAKSPAERPQDAQSLLRAMKEALITPPEPAPAPSAPHPRSRARVAFLGGGLGLALVGALAFAFWPSAPPPPPPREVAIRPLPPPAPVSVPVPPKVAPAAPEPRVAAPPRPPVALPKHAKASRPPSHAADEDPFEERR
jgi:serine/threonine-protein kinase